MKKLLKTLTILSLLLFLPINASYDELGFQWQQAGFFEGIMLQGTFISVVSLCLLAPLWTPLKNFMVHANTTKVISGSIISHIISLYAIQKILFGSEYNQYVRLYTKNLSQQFKQDGKNFFHRVLKQKVESSMSIFDKVIYLIMSGERKYGKIRNQLVDKEIVDASTYFSLHLATQEQYENLLSAYKRYKVLHIS